MPTYQSRRRFVASLFDPLVVQVVHGSREVNEPTGWARVDRTVTKLRTRLAAASNEEDFQIVGLLSRECLISTAQAVFVPKSHPTIDGVPASPTGAKRMLEAYLMSSLSGSSAEYIRKHARAALDVAVNLQHKRTASFRDAALCSEATTSVVNLVAIIAGLRDPEGMHSSDNVNE